MNTKASRADIEFLIEENIEIDPERIDDKELRNYYIKRMTEKAAPVKVYEHNDADWSDKWERKPDPKFDVAENFRKLKVPEVF